MLGLLVVYCDEFGLMLCYWNWLEEMKVVFKGDWFIIGDWVWVDLEGYYWYEGCVDDLMNVFGYWVVFEEIEWVLFWYFDVVEVVVMVILNVFGIDLIMVFVVL